MNQMDLQGLVVADHRELQLAAPALPAVGPPAAALVEAPGGRVPRRPKNRAAVPRLAHRRLAQLKQAARDTAPPVIWMDIEVGDVADSRPGFPLLAVFSGAAPGAKRH